MQGGGYCWNSRRKQKSTAMAQQYSSLISSLKQFIENQKLFFVGTAMTDGRINISSKGMDSLRVMSDNRIIWLNVTGSGNETTAHIQENPRMTVEQAPMEFCQ